MRHLFLFFAFCLVFYSSFSQYYLRGELKDEQGKGISNGRMTLFSKGNFVFSTGSSGDFGIPSGLKLDTVTFFLEGYDTLKSAVLTSRFGNFVLKSARKKVDNSLHLSSYTKGFPYASVDNYDEEDINRSSYIKNTIANSVNYPETTLGLHVNKASYSKIKQLLNNKEQPSADDAQIEEMLAYFNLKPETAEPAISQKTFTLHTQITSCPWNEHSRLLFVNVVAKKIDLEKTSPANIVFLIDASGSMDVFNRLPVIKSAFKLLAENLRPIDKVTIITYGDIVTVLLPATSGAEKQKIIEAIEGLRPNGSTPGASAIRMAYAKARENFVPNGNNRIILATDGDFNVGETSAKGLQELVKRESKDSIYLSCIAVGIDKDEMVESLAKAGQGNFAYLDNETNAEKILVEEFAQASYAVSNNVVMNVHFNAKSAKEYRLIGFDNKRNIINTNITNTQGGEAGSGQALMAAFEFTPSGNETAPVANITLSYQLPDKNDVSSENYETDQNFLPIEKVERTYRFASAVIAFGEMLKQSPYYNDFSWNDLENLVESSVTPGNLVQQELGVLIAKARKIYPSRRKGKIANGNK